MSGQDPSPDEIDALLFRARMPAIAMLRTPKATDQGTPGCFFDGAPNLPPDHDWPWFTYPYEPYKGFSLPMHFLLQINLQYVPRVIGLPQLPPSGTLFVFYDPIAAAFSPPTRRDPIPLQAGHGVHIFHYPGDVTQFPPRPMPPLPDLTPIEEDAIECTTPSQPSWPIDFVVVDTYQLEGFAAAAGEMLSANETRNLLLIEANGWVKPQGARDSIAKFTPLSRMFGASREPLYPTREDRIREGWPDWPALSSDDVLLFRNIGDIYWGDQATAFWINRQDLENQDFSKVSIWMERI